MSNIQEFDVRKEHYKQTHMKVLTGRCIVTIHNPSGKMLFLGDFDWSP